MYRVNKYFLLLKTKKGLETKTNPKAMKNSSA